MKIRALILVLALAMTGAVHAQGVGSSGQITGTVTDPTGATVPQAQVTVTDTQRGITRSVETDSSGQYQVPGLLPSTYDVSAQAAGFDIVIQKGLVVTVGEISIADFHLRVSASVSTVAVTAAPPVVDTERGSQADTIGRQFINDLPINRRDYLSFTLLAPGVSNATRLASDQDFRVKQTPQSGLSFYGSNGRGNSVTVDGGEANDDSGGVRLTLSQDAVQEFQINRSDYSAELGSASGASINIVSKSGTNQVHGSLYGFFRNDALDARDPFAFSQALQPGQVFNPLAPDSSGRPVKDSLSRQQYGGTIGFPIQKDKTFLFVAFEGLRQDAQNAVPLLTDTSIFRPQASPQNNQLAILNGLTAEGGTPVPCLTGQPALPAATCAAILGNVLTINPAASPLNAFLVNQFEDNGGLFAYNTREYLASVRLDHQFSDSDQAFLRYSFGHDVEKNPDVQSLTGFSRGSSIHTHDDTLQGSWFHQFSPRTQNELRLQFSYSEFNVLPNEPAQAGLDIPGFANLGTNIFLPSLSILRRYEFADNITMIRGRHTMKFGFYELYRGNHTESHTFFPGRFEFGSLPGGLLSPCLQVPAACGLAANTATLNALQSASLGLPQFYQQGFGSPVYNYPRPFTAGYWQDSWQIASNFTFNYGLRYELDSQYGPLNTDKDNFAPRISFAWDPFKDHKTVIRGGFGIFYAPTYGQIPDVVKTLGNVNNTRQIAILLVPLTGAPGQPALNSAAIFQTLFAQGKIQCTAPAAGSAACITPSDLTQFGINVSNTGPLPPAPGAPPLPVIFSGQPDYQNPYSEQAEIGVERELAGGLSVSISGIYSHTLRLPVAIDTNLLKVPASAITTVPLANGKTASFQNWGSAACAANPFACFVNPLILQNDVYSSKSSALYEGGIVEVRKRFSQHFSLLANYTYSKAFDTSTDFNSDFGPQDNTNLAAERALSDFDQRHKVVAAGVFNSPTTSWALSGWELSPIFSYNSPHPFNLLTGVDVNGDRHFTNDRPIGAGRNTGIGPNFINFDMRLSRSFRLTEQSSLQFIAEGFNIANRTNYASVNNIVSPDFAVPTALGGLGNTTFNVHGSAALSPSEPLGFTSAFPKRQIQLGVRFSF